MPKGIPRNQSIQQKILHRMKIARGQLDSVITMVENGKYCIHVVEQSLAIQSALKKTDEIIIKNHMETCVAEEIRKGNTKEVIEEVMKVMEKRNG
jgi:DNA-binding FrmR family transcriptional regulator